MAEIPYMRLQIGQLSHFLLLATNSHRPPVEREKDRQRCMYIYICVYTILHLFLYNYAITCVHLSSSIFIYAITVSLHVLNDIMHYKSEIHCALLMLLSVLYIEVKDGNEIIKYRIILLYVVL